MITEITYETHITENEKVIDIFHFKTDRNAAHRYASDVNSESNCHCGDCKYGGPGITAQVIVVTTLKEPDETLDSIKKGWYL